MSNLNFVQATLGLPVTNTGNVITLNPAVAPYQLPPTDGGILVLTDSMGLPTVFEIISYSARSGNNLTGVVRGLEGTTARAWPANSYSFQALTAGGLTTLQALKQDFITAGTAAQYYRGDKTMATLDKTAVGLSNVDNTSDVNKPVSTAQQTALNLKVDKAGSVTSVAARTGAVVLTKADVSLNNVDNTADTAKPVSTAQQTALNGKVDLAGGVGSRMTGELQTTAVNFLRSVSGNYGFMLRNDGAALYGLVTDSGNQYGSFNDFRPFTLNLATGILGINGNSASTDKLKTARKIGGTLFDGTADIGIDAQWKGDTAETMPTGTAAYASTDANLLVDGIYGGTAKGFPINYGNRMQIRGHALAVNEVYFEWTNGGANRVFVRSRADVNTHQWSAMREVAFVDGNVATATKLATARTISLTGEVTGSVIFDGSGNAAIVTTVVDDSHNHIIANVDGLQAALDSKLGATANAAAAVKLVTARTINGVAFDGTANITIADGTKEPTIASGTTAQFWRGDKSWQDLATAVRAASLTGLSTPNTPVVATDSVLTGMGKLQGQLNNGTATIGGLIDTVNTLDDFDARLMWQFATSSEGWTASGSTLTFGTKAQMTQTSSGTDPYLSSPTSLAINGNVYGRIRARITRVAGSGWDGTAYYVNTGHAVSSSYRNTLPNPNIAIGQTMILEWDMWNLTAGADDWFNTVISQIRLDLGATAADIFTIDYITVGRTGPNLTQVLGQVGVGSSGIITGAIIERGTNANGEYAKFADGTMVCWFQRPLTNISYGSAYGAFWYGTNAWTFPAAFVTGSVPSVNEQLTSGGRIIWSALLSATPTNCSFYVLNTANETISCTALFMAIGRWY